MSQTPSKLERRARALLRAYPAEYRHGRAEEIIGTLLEAAPPGRSFPPAREAWSLIAGGRHARAARNRRLGVKANVRLALLLGLSTYLIGFASALSSPGTRWDSSRATARRGSRTRRWRSAPPRHWPRGWAAGRRRRRWPSPPARSSLTAELRGNHGSPVTVSLAEDLIVMAALAAMSGGPVRLPRSWLWLPCAFPLTLAAGRLLSPQHVPGPVFDELPGAGRAVAASGRRGLLARHRRPPRVRLPRNVAGGRDKHPALCRL